MSKLVKPANVESDTFRSAKWDELTAGRDFSQADAPTLALLVSWYQVVEQCMEDIGANGGVQVAYQNDMGDIKALPQLSTMKQASAEIRARRDAYGRFQYGWCGGRLHGHGDGKRDGWQREHAGAVWHGHRRKPACPCSQQSLRALLVARHLDLLLRSHEHRALLRKLRQSPSLAADAAPRKVAASDAERPGGLLLPAASGSDMAS